MQTVSSGDNMHEMTILLSVKNKISTLFPWKNEKYILNLSSAELFQRMLTSTTLVTNSAADKFIIHVLFLFFPENGLWHF